MLTDCGESVVVGWSVPYGKIVTPDDDARKAFAGEFVFASAFVPSKGWECAGI